MIDKVQSSYIYGFIEKDSPGKVKLQGTDELYPMHLKPSSTIKKIKIWFGAPKEKNDIKSIIAIQVKYINYITGEKKETAIQGSSIDGTDITTEELEIKEGDYLSKFNIGFEDYITHIKFSTKKSNSIELGTIIEENEKRSTNEINEKDNIILNIKGYYTPNGIRAIGVDYIPFKDFCFIRLMDVFRLRLRLKKNEVEKKKYTEEAISKLNYEAQCFIKLCLLPDKTFLGVIKYV